MSRFEDPRNPRESPFAQHIREELLPSVRRRQKGVTGSGTGWLAGMEQLDDPAAFSRFIASRLAYRRLGRSAWLLLAPIVVILALHLPGLALRSARAGALSTRPGILVAFTLIELLLVVLLAGAALRRTTRALSALALDEGQRNPNDTARALARDLVTTGFAGLVTAHTCRPELTRLGGGFYANAGCIADVVTEMANRVPGLGLPSVFLSYRETAWVELEAGNELHARLFHARQALPGATLVERVLAERIVESNAAARHPEVVATFPVGEGWPRPHTVETRQRRVRRVASLVVFAAGFLSLVSTFAEPVRDRLTALSKILPLVVPETAAALAALGGIGLVVLARGIRRGQRRAWLVCLAILLSVAVLHLIRGVDVVEALLALAVAGYLWLNRASFEAKTDVARLGRGVLGVAGAAVLTVMAGTLAVKLGSWIGPSDRRLLRLSWSQATLAALERMVGVTHITLPMRLNEFFSPAMATASTGLALALVLVLFRPVVQHRHHPVAALARPLRAGRSTIRSTQPAGWIEPEPSWLATAREPSTTSRCGPTSSSSSGAAPSWRMLSTAGCAWCRPTPSDRWPSGRRPGGRSVATSTRTGGRSAASASPRNGCPSTGRRGCVICTWATRGSCASVALPSKADASRGCAKR